MSSGVQPPRNNPAGRPSRAGRLVRYVPLALAAWVVLEIWLMILLADLTGALTVLLVLLAAALLGGAVVKRAGRRAVAALNGLRGRTDGTVPLSPPGSQGNGLALLAGLLLILPGIASDVLGLALLLPPVRKAVSRAAERSLQRRMQTSAAPGGFQETLRQARIHRPDGKVVQGEVVRDGQDPAPETHGEPPEGPRRPLRP